MRLDTFVLSVDPGDSTGLCRWTPQGELIERWIMSSEETIGYLARTDDYEAIVVEDFRLRHGKAVQQTGSRFEASQVIGAIRMYCRIHGAALYRQEPNILPVAQLHSGVKPPANHKLSHDIDAYNHGYYFFEQRGILLPARRNILA